MNPLDVATDLLTAGISVLPIACDGSKAPSIPPGLIPRLTVTSASGRSTGSWEPLQRERLTIEEARLLFSRHVGIGIIAGAISGGLELIDVEGHAPLQALAEAIQRAAPGLIERLVIVQTPKGGRHMGYRCQVIAGNSKLAMDLNPETGKPRTMIETRGEGGYVVAPGSPTECHPSGKPYVLRHGKLTEFPTITPVERATIWDVCRSFNQYVRPDRTTAVTAPKDRDPNDVRPGDDYNARGNALELLQRHGWSVVYSRGDAHYLKRPGKKEPGISASYGKVAPNVLYVFSSNADPFEFDRAYDAFGTYAQLEHKGDFESASKALRKEGYGSARRPTPLTPPAFPVAPPLADGTPAPTAESQAVSTDPNQDAVATLFESIYKDTFRHCAQWGQWLQWVTSHWAPERTHLVFDRAADLTRVVNVTGIKELTKASFVTGVEKFIAARRTFATTPRDWDREPMVIASPGGVVDLRTGLLRPASPLDYITKCMRVTPSPGPHPVFDRFMYDICLGDIALVNYFQRALGSMLSGALTDHWIMFWIGNGSNGKNTLGDLIAWIMGDYAKVIPSDTLMSSMSGNKHPTDMANLRGVRMAISSEVSEGAFWDDARIKSLTGDETISARFMRQDFFEFQRTHKHVVFGNNRPSLRVVDMAMRRRFHIVPFNATFDEETRDPEMSSKLRTEHDHIAWWLVEGHLLWLEDGTLKRCTAVQAETDAYFEAQSTPEMWVSECCLPPAESHGKLTRASDLYGSYQKWKEDRGEKSVGKSRWAEWMTKHGYVLVKNSGLHYRDIALDPTVVQEESRRGFWDKDNY